VVTAEALAPFRVAQHPGRKAIRSRCPTWSMPRPKPARLHWTSKSRSPARRCAMPACRRSA
jgi:hypothetical protein